MNPLIGLLLNSVCGGIALYYALHTNPVTDAPIKIFWSVMVGVNGFAVGLWLGQIIIRLGLIS